MIFNKLFGRKKNVTVITKEELIKRKEKAFKQNFMFKKYCMKCVIKGDRNTGKSTLMNRMLGLPFTPEYNPTEQIRVKRINWHYRTLKDEVMIDLWDIVDQTFVKKTSSDKLKLTHDAIIKRIESSKNNPKNIPKRNVNTVKMCDAEMIGDVYKNTNCVFLLYDPRKRWTFDYVSKELEKISKREPKLSVLIIRNFEDTKGKENNKWEVLDVEITKLVKEYEERGCFEDIKWMGMSLEHGFGMKEIYLFFNVPFLHHKRMMLEKEMLRINQEIETSRKEMEMLLEMSSFESYLRKVKGNPVLARTKFEEEAEKNHPNSRGKKVSERTKVRGRGSPRGRGRGGRGGRGGGANAGKIQNEEKKEQNPAKKPNEEEEGEDVRPLIVAPMSITPDADKSFYTKVKRNLKKKNGENPVKNASVKNQVDSPKKVFKVKVQADDDNYDDFFGDEESEDEDSDFFEKNEKEKEETEEETEEEVEKVNEEDEKAESEKEKAKREEMERKKAEEKRELEENFKKMMEEAKIEEEKRLQEEKEKIEKRKKEGRKRGRGRGKRSRGKRGRGRGRGRGRKSKGTRRKKNSQISQTQENAQSPQPPQEIPGIDRSEFEQL